MSKKSRKRNRRLLKALGAGLAIAGLGGAFRKSPVTTPNTIMDNMPKGGDEFKETVVTNVVKPSAPKEAPSSYLSRMTGGNKDKGLSGQQKRAAYAKRQRNILEDKRRNDMMRAIRSTQDIMTAPSTGNIFEDSGVADYYQSAKKGGRIVKGKKTAVRKVAAKRGFGRAYKGGK
mgnify:CR=1 FL=1